MPLGVPPYEYCDGCCRRCPIATECPRAGHLELYRAPEATPCALDTRARHYGDELDALGSGLPPGTLRDELLRSAQVIPARASAVATSLLSSHPVRFTPKREDTAIAQLLLVDHLTTLCRQAVRGLQAPHTLERSRVQFVSELTPYLLKVPGRTRLNLHRAVQQGGAPSPFCVLDPQDD